MNNFNVLSRRSFLDRTTKVGLATALGTLTNIPLVVKKALAEGTIGLQGKKLLFIWLRFGNDGLNNIVPIGDDEYRNIRGSIEIPKEAGLDYSLAGGCDFPKSSPTVGANNFNTYWYTNGIRTGNGFAALHPALKFLAPVHNAGDLALVHRVAYPKQSRSHFDSQNYWENGNPGNNMSKDGIFYRTIIESGLANTSPLTGVSIQSSLPLLLRGTEAAMTNLTSPTRYDLIGVPSGGNDAKAFNAMAAANYFPFPPKKNRDLLEMQYQNMSNTLRIFAGMDFGEVGNTFRVNKGNAFGPGEAGTDGDAAQYYLFPTTNNKNGGFQGSVFGGGRPDNANKYVVPTGHYGFFNNLKAAAMILNQTDAIVAGTELGGFDTHGTQGGATGQHANLLRSVGWSFYALQQYFTHYAEKADWDDVVVVAFSEFGRTSVENSDLGTDHAEAGVMYAAGGAIKGYNNGTAGVFGCSPNDSIPWRLGGYTKNVMTCNTMYGGNFAEGNNTVTPATAGYLRRSSDYRSILGEIIRKHLGATQSQLDRIIPGYAKSTEKLLAGGTSGIDGVPILGELGIL